MPVGGALGTLISGETDSFHAEFLRPTNGSVRIDATVLTNGPAPRVNADVRNEAGDLCIRCVGSPLVRR